MTRAFWFGASIILSLSVLQTAAAQPAETETVDGTGIESVDGTGIDAAGNTYTIQPGDTLVSIARKLYGDATKWQEIYNANRTLIADPNFIRAGVTLSIPDAAD